MAFRQLFDPESSTYTYILGDPERREAVIVDPVRVNIERDLATVAELGMKLVWILDTHVHADHVTGAKALKQRTGAPTVVNAHCGASGFDRLIGEGELIVFGNEVIRAIATPGHTPGSTCYLWRDRLLTGDTLLIGGCGRTDFQRGSAEALYDSITGRLFTLPDDTLVYPGHDYHGRRVSTIGEEKATNPRLAGKSREEFVEIMNALDLPEPQQIRVAVPANLEGGTP
ncbi:MAG: MBL fold metallo-hydrolase [Burkholderiales bacterium]|nr:MBL fold metallo-hydrolase [Burkholderiales bacterium]